MRSLNIITAVLLIAGLAGCGTTDEPDTGVASAELGVCSMACNGGGSVSCKANLCTFNDGVSITCDGVVHACPTTPPPTSCTATLDCEAGPTHLSCSGTSCTKILSTELGCVVCPAGQSCGDYGVGCAPYGQLSYKVCGAVSCNGTTQYCPALPGNLECW